MLQVDRRGNGTAMFATKEDMEDAVKTVDSTEMKNMRGTCQLRVDYSDAPGGGGGRDDRDRDYDDRRPPPRRDSRCATIDI